MPPPVNAPAPSGHRPLLRLAVRALLVVFAAAALLRVFVFEPYSIPSVSMTPTLMQGDVVLVNKISYLTAPLGRNDVVVFDPPPYVTRGSEDEGTEYVKRCVAVAGDTVQLRDGRIWVNSREVPPLGDAPRVWTRRSPIEPDVAFPPLRSGQALVTPRRGMRIELDSGAWERWRWLIERENSSAAFRNRIVFINGLPASRYFVQGDYFFVLGDNASESYDSRFFGFVPMKNLVGKALIVYWSREPENGIRWERIGKIVP